MALFNSIITFTDIHFGMKNNSKEHNEDCISFLEFMIEKAKSEGIKTCAFMGDYFHNRSYVNISTLDYGLRGMRMLNENFEKVYFIVGNHDMYYKNKRDVTSINMAESFDNITFINEMTTIDDCTFIPFMIDDEYKNLPSISSKYVFGHLELPGYLLNKMISMPDLGKETENSFQSSEYVFSGHFHKRQEKITKNGVKIVYTGNCFPHNFSDTWDDDRGCMTLVHGSSPVYHRWNAAPKYRTCTMTEFLREPSYYVCDEVFLKIQVDIPIDSDDVKFIKDIFAKKYKIRDYTITYLRTSTSQDGETIKEEDVNTKSVDEIVLTQIRNIDSNTLDKHLLEEIYLDL